MSDESHRGMRSGHLTCVGDDVSMRDHDTFLYVGQQTLGGCQKIVLLTGRPEVPLE